MSTQPTGHMVTDDADEDVNASAVGSPTRWATLSTPGATSVDRPCDLLDQHRVEAAVPARPSRDRLH